VICNFIDGITYGSIVDDMLNFTEGINGGMKRVIFFWRACSVFKIIGKFINNGLTHIPEITDEHITDGIFCP
jgi:hypothetical protein